MAWAELTRDLVPSCPHALIRALFEPSHAVTRFLSLAMLEGVVRVLPSRLRDQIQRSKAEN